MIESPNGMTRRGVSEAAEAAPAGAAPATVTPATPSAAATSVAHGRIQDLLMRFPFPRYGSVVHFWLFWPLQVHRTTGVPLAVPAPLTSRHRPAWTLRTDPSACLVHFWSA